MRGEGWGEGGREKGERGGYLTPLSSWLTTISPSSFSVVMPSSESAASAAHCSACFLDWPHRDGNLRAPISTATSKHLAWSGPCSSMTM